MAKKNDLSNVILLFLLFLSGGVIAPSTVQAQNKIRIHGTVSELDGKKQVPLDFATVSFPDYGIGTTTSNGGKYVLNNVPAGKVRIRVQYIGKHTVDTVVNVRTDQQFNFTLQNEDFHLQEVTVTARHNAAGKATSSNISRQAMDHMQANSLFDLMALIPGGISENQDLSTAKTLTLRQVYDSRSQAVNSLGTAIIRDGAPLSNNANLNVLSAASSLESNSGTMGGVGGLTTPSAGVDVRSISTENIEDVEVVRGIPSVEYGDLTSGAVIIHSKAGHEPLRIKAKANPKVYQGSIGKGFGLGGNKGSLNLSADYAYNINDPMQSYIHYQRLTGKALYSNTFFNNRLRSNTSLDFTYGKDQRDKNPVDEITKVNERGETAGLSLNTNGLWNINKGWLENVRYVVSGTYMATNSYHEAGQSSASAPYSGVMTDGTVLSNKAGEHLFDADGNEITHFSAADAGYFAYYLPSSYISHYNLDSKEINIFAKLTANFFKHFGRVNNRILLGADFKTDGNEGKGKFYNQMTPPMRSQYYDNSSHRPRSYKDIPWVTQYGVFAEENFNWLIGRHAFNLQAGLRYDHASVVGGTFSPRVNASLDIVPEVLTIRGGYGITAKMPTLFYLYPQEAYFEYININELTNEAIPEAERQFITTTRVFDTQNRNLKVAKNHKAEIGFDVHFGKIDLAVTGFTERLRNGYSMASTLESFRQVTYNKYARNDDGQLYLTGSYPVLSGFNMPTNNRSVFTKGVEFELNLGRIEAIRTSFQLNGAWMNTKSWSDGYYVYDDNAEAPDSRYDIPIIAGHRNEFHEQQFSTALRATHNIPRIGFVVTLTAQAVWQQMNWETYGNDTIPVGYLSQQTGQPVWFQAGQYPTKQSLRDAGMGYLLQSVSHTYAIRDSYSPYFCFNLNLTKEIGEMLRVSFFANNVFRSYPRRESKRSPGTYMVMNRGTGNGGNRFYFGIELSLKI